MEISRRALADWYYEWLGGLCWTNALNLALPPQRLRPDTRLEHQDPVRHTAQVYSCPQSPLPHFCDGSLSIQIFHRCRVHQVDCGDLICCFWGSQRNFPFFSLFAQLLGFSFVFGPASACRSPSGVCSSPRQEGVKRVADSGALAHSGWGRKGYGMRGEPAAAEAGITLQQPEARSLFFWGSCSWIMGPWPWLAAQAPRGEVWIVTCTCTQASWWLQQQP